MHKWADKINELQQQTHTTTTATTKTIISDSTNNNNNNNNNNNGVLSRINAVKEKLKKKGGINRGKDYNHSTFIDLIIAGLIGLQPSFKKQTNNNVLRNKLVINPLLPLLWTNNGDIRHKWSYYCLDGVLYHNHLITVLWDETGEKYQRGAGYKIYVDGVLKRSLKTIQKVILYLD